jgi:hypothetical protein
MEVTVNTRGIHGIKPYASRGRYIHPGHRQEMAHLPRQRPAMGHLRTPFDRDTLDTLNAERHEPKTGRTAPSHQEGTQDDRLRALAVHAAETASALGELLLVRAA